MSNVEHTKFIRNTNLFIDQGYIKNGSLLAFKRYSTLPLHQHENKTVKNKQYDSEQVAYQTKNTKGDTSTESRNIWFQTGVNYKNLCGT